MVPIVAGEAKEEAPIAVRLAEAIAPVAEIETDWPPPIGDVLPLVIRSPLPLIVPKFCTAAEARIVAAVAVVVAKDVRNLGPKEESARSAAVCRNLVAATTWERCWSEAVAGAGMLKAG